MRRLSIFLVAASLLVCLVYSKGPGNNLKVDIGDERTIKNDKIENFGDKKYLVEKGFSFGLHPLSELPTEGNIGLIQTYLGWNRGNQL